MNKIKKVYPAIQKSISDFLQDDEGTTLRTKAAIIGPTAIAAVVLMSKDLVTASASKFVSHRSHVSHSSSSQGNTVNHATHGSHSSRISSGFGHTADTYNLELRDKE